MKLVDQPNLPPAEYGQLFTALGVDVLAVQIDLALGGNIHSRDNVQERRFSGSGGADDGGKFPFFNY